MKMMATLIRSYMVALYTHVDLNMARLSIPHTSTNRTRLLIIHGTAILSNQDIHHI